MRWTKLKSASGSVGDWLAAISVLCTLQSPSFFFNHTATTKIYTLSLHDALPIYRALKPRPPRRTQTCHRALGTDERRAVLDVLHEPRFAELAPAQVYATLL